MRFLKGAVLRCEMDQENLGHEPLIEELIYKDTITMFSAKSGVGKSVITSNICAYGSRGDDVFGVLKVQKPLKIAYCQMEGSRDEALSRLKSMESGIGLLNTDNITWHTPQIIVEDTATWTPFMAELALASPFEICIIDPIYAMSSKGLVKEETCLAVKRLLDMIKAEFKCALVVTNHVPKDSITTSGKRVKREDPFGSTWLNANLDAAYFMDRDIDGDTDNVVTIKATKSRGSNIIRNLALKFDISTYLMKGISDGSATQARFKVRDFLKRKFDVNSFATNAEISRGCNISLRHLQRMRMDGYFDDIAQIQNNNGKETVWMKKL